MAEVGTQSVPSVIQDILNEEQIHQVVTKCVGTTEWRLVASEIRPASEHLMGYLGKHWRVKIHVEVGNEAKTEHVFVKSMPVENEALIQFLNESNIYQREMIVLKLLDEAKSTQGGETFYPKVLLCSETVVVMSDLCAEGYEQRPPVEPFDLQHLLVTFAALARLHAAVANYETGRSITENRPYTVLQEYGDIITKTNFQDLSWLRAACNNAYKFIVTYFPNNNAVSGLEERLLDFFIKSYATLKQYDDTLNVLIHRDLWVNNIMFRYKGTAPTNAVLLDFQVATYAPPAFDVMFTLYLNSSRELRDRHQTEILRHYYEVFEDSLDSATRRRLEGLKYDYEQFASWCERGRSFGATLATCVLPYTMLVRGAAFDSEREFFAYITADRTDRKLQHSKQCPQYRNRIIDLYTEFIDRYVSKFK